MGFNSQGNLGTLNQDDRFGGPHTPTWKVVMTTPSVRQTLSFCCLRAAMPRVMRVESGNGESIQPKCEFDRPQLP